jgi:hypothetical protein
MWQKHLRAIKHPNWAIATAIPGIIFVVGCSTIVCLLIERESILNRFLSAAQSRAAILKAKSSLTPSEISEINVLNWEISSGPQESTYGTKVWEIDGHIDGTSAWTTLSFVLFLSSGSMWWRREWKSVQPAADMAHH